MALNGTTISKEGLEYLCGLIRDINGLDTNLIDDLNIKSNGTFSSVRINTLLNALKTDCNDFANSLVSNISRLELKIVTDESSIVDSNILYLYKPPTGQTSYNQYVVIEGNKVLLGTTDINMSDYYTITQADTKFTLKTDFNSLKTEVTTLKTKVGTDTLNTTSQDLSGGVNELKTDLTTHTNDTDIHITTAERTKWNEVDNKIDKTDITTTISSSSTDSQVPSALAVLNLKKARRLDESVNPENYEVGDWYAEGKDGILLSTSYGHPCSSWHIGYIVTGFRENNSNNGYKKILAITRDGDCYIKTQKWNTWTEWQKLCTTSDTDIHVTTGDKAKWNEVDNKIDKTDINTTISSSSTNTQVPSAKSVYNLAGNENRRGYVYNNPTYRGNKWNRVFRVNSLLSCDSGFLTVTVYSNSLCQIATFLMSKNFNRLNIKQINCGGYNGDKGQTRPIKVRIVSAETIGFSFLEIYVSGTSNTNVVATYMPLSCNSVVVLNEEGSIPNGLFACEMTATHDTYENATYTSILK